MEQPDDTKKAGRIMGERTIESLGQAFREYRTPFENQQFIQRFVAGLDVARLARYAGHFRIERTSGGPALQVHFGSTIGFLSEDEIRALLGDMSRFPSKDLPGYWGVEHPVQSTAGGGGPGTAGSKLDTAKCPSCGNVMSLRGCDFCG